MAPKALGGTLKSKDSAIKPLQLISASVAGVCSFLNRKLEWEI